MTKVVSLMPRLKTGTAKILQSGQEIATYLFTPNPSKHKNFVMTHQFGISYLIYGGLTQRETMVLMYLVSEMDFNNACDKSGAEIARDLKIAQGDVSKILKSLNQKHGLIQRLRKIGNVTVWMINPDFASKVSLKPHLELSNLYQSLEIESQLSNGGHTTHDEMSA